MGRGQHSVILLAGLLLIAAANGLFLGLTLYGALGAVLKVVHVHAPSFDYALLVGAIGAGGIVAASLLRERALRHDEYMLWTPMPAQSEEHPLVLRLRELTRKTSLDRPPSLGWIESPEKNAFAVAHSRNEASIILTSGLIESLPSAEMDAVLAQQLAHVEREDVKAVGFADAVADSVRDLTRVKGHFLWGPMAIVRDTVPLLIVTVVGGALLTGLEGSNSSSAAASLVLLLVTLGLLYAFWQALKQSWRGLGQLMLQGTFFGPMSLVEAVLAPPTAFLLSRLVSRARIHEADCRAVELTGDPQVLMGALRRVANVEDGPTAAWLGDRRFSLFVASPIADGRWVWWGRQRATHPSIESRLEKIAEAGEATRPAPPARGVGRRG
ncbi:MAG TPA: M48 family metalloprotease [Solirubrobacterales bacterium]|nr:M48 family metalloprotease [Solirubrobacterales bacterium]